MNDAFRSRSSAAVLVLVRNLSGKNAEILLMERSARVKTHQSQVAFPGGGMEAQDENDPIKTALRECYEEVGIYPHHVKIQKTLPPLPTLTSGFFVVPVMGVFNQESEPILTLDSHEVAYAEWVSVEALLKTKKTENGFPVFEWVGMDQKIRKVWGLTAIIFALIFNSDAETL